MRQQKVLDETGAHRYSMDSIKTVINRTKEVSEVKSNVILIDNQENGFDQAIGETRKVAVYEELSHKESLKLQLCAERY